MECKICRATHTDIEQVLNHVRVVHGLLPVQYLTTFDYNGKLRFSVKDDNNPAIKLAVREEVETDPLAVIKTDQPPERIMVLRQSETLSSPGEQMAKVVYVQQDSPPSIIPTAVIKAKASPSKFKCPACSKTFTNERIYAGHLKVHTGESPFECSVCGNGLRSRSSLDEHMRAHSAAKGNHCKVTLRLKFVLCPFIYIYDYAF